MRPFKAIETNKQAFAGDFRSIEELRQSLALDILNLVRVLWPRRRSKPSVKLEIAARLTDLIRVYRERDITPEEFRAYREIIGIQLCGRMSALARALGAEREWLLDTQRQTAHHHGSAQALAHQSNDGVCSHGLPEMLEDTATSLVAALATP